MTNLSVIIGDLKPYPVSHDVVIRNCVKFGLDAASEYEVSDEGKVARVVVEILAQMLMLKSVSEGGVSLSFSDESAIKSLIRRKCKEAGLEYSDYVNEPIVTRLE